MEQVIKAVEQACRSIDIAIVDLKDDDLSNEQRIANALGALDRAQKALSVLVWTTGVPTQ